MPTTYKMIGGKRLIEVPEDGPMREYRAVQHHKADGGTGKITYSGWQWHWVANHDDLDSKTELQIEDLGTEFPEPSEKFRID